MMVAEQKSSRRAGNHGGGGLGMTTEGRHEEYTTGRIFASTKRAGSILDQWVIDTYMEAARWQRLFELSGETPEPKTAAVLDYLTHRFMRDTAGQMACFLAWREHSLTEPRRDPPADIPAHNFAELAQNVDAFHRVLCGLDRLEAEEVDHE